MDDFFEAIDDIDTRVKNIKDCDTYYKKEASN